MWDGDVETAGAAHQAAVGASKAREMYVTSGLFGQWPTSRFVAFAAPEREARAEASFAGVEVGTGGLW